MSHRIRAAQMAVFERAKAAELVSALTGTLAESYPALAAELGAAELERRLLEAAERARQHGIEKSNDLARYLNIACALGPRFDEDDRYPWARPILASPEMTPSGKVDRLAFWARRTLAEAHGAAPGAGR
jgi:hypothetical protein